jgi:hypothetical protein
MAQGHGWSLVNFRMSAVAAIFRQSPELVLRKTRKCV